MANSMLFCQRTWPQSQPTINDFSCLTKEQKAAIEVCFEENQYCHKQVASRDITSKLFSPGWDTILYFTLAGIASGMIIDYKITH